MLPVAFLAARDDGSGDDPLVCHGDMGLVAEEGCIGCLVPNARVSVLGFGEVLEVVFCCFLEEIKLFLDGGDGGDAFVLFNVRDEFFAVVELVLEDAALPFLGHGVLLFGGDVPVDGLPEELCMVAERLVRAFLVIARFGVGGVDDDALFFDDAFFDGDGNGLFNEEVEDVFVSKAQLAEFCERRGVDDVVFGAQPEEVLEGHIVLAPLDKVSVGHGVVCLEDEILEEHDG